MDLCCSAQTYPIIIYSTSVYHKLQTQLNCSAERVHWFLNVAIGIYCEHHQTLWEKYLQPVVYVHNVTPITGTKNIDPFHLVFGQHAPSPEVLSMILPLSPLTRVDYATYLVCRMHKAQKEFNATKMIYIVLSDSITIKMLAS